MKVIQWIINTRNTRIWSRGEPRWDYDIILHCCFKGDNMESNGVCYCFSENRNALRTYINPLKRNLRIGEFKPEEDYG